MHLQTSTHLRSRRRWRRLTAGDQSDGERKFGGVELFDSNVASTRARLSAERSQLSGVQRWRISARRRRMALIRLLSVGIMVRKTQCENPARRLWQKNFNPVPSDYKDEQEARHFRATRRAQPTRFLVLRSIPL
ncbi:hypothetical protein AB1N83_013050 [Pleurotus pulmonarius]